MFGEHALEIGAVSADVVETFDENTLSPVACLDRLGAPDRVDLGIARVEPAHEAGIAVDFQEREELVSEFSLKRRFPQRHHNSGVGRTCNSRIEGCQAMELRFRQALGHARDSLAPSTGRRAA